MIRNTRKQDILVYSVFETKPSEKYPNSGWLCSYLIKGASGWYKPKTGGCVPIDKDTAGDLISKMSKSPFGVCLDTLE